MIITLAKSLLLVLLVLHILAFAKSVLLVIQFYFFLELANHLLLLLVSVVNEITIFV